MIDIQDAFHARVGGKSSASNLSGKMGDAVLPVSDYQFPFPNRRAKEGAPH